MPPDQMQRNPREDFVALLYTAADALVAELMRA